MNQFPLMQMNHSAWRMKQNHLATKLKKKMRLNCSNIVSWMLIQDESNQGIIKKTCDPEFIIWRNLGILDLKRKVKLVRNIVVLAIIVGFTYVSIDWIKAYRGSLFGEYLPELEV